MRNGKVLLVDHEEYNLDILDRFLSNKGFTLIKARNIFEGLEKLAKHSDIDLVLLEWTMPGGSSIAMLRKLKSDPLYKDTPVIVMGIDPDKKDVQLGLELGIYYFISKPYERDILLCKIQSAIRRRMYLNNLHCAGCLIANKDIELKSGLTKLIEGKFEYRTVKGAKKIASVIAGATNNSDQVMMAITELLVNAIEHGNLEIDSDTKSRLMLENLWEEELEFRLNSEYYKNRKACVEIIKKDNKLIIKITDEGSGFDWKEHMRNKDVDSSKINGRGIYIAAKDLLSVEYQGKGNEVICSCHV